MTKVVIDVRDDNRTTLNGEVYKIASGVLQGLLSILIPPPKPVVQWKKIWARRVDNGQWVQVWIRQY